MAKKQPPPDPNCNVLELAEAFFNDCRHPPAEHPRLLPTIVAAGELLAERGSPSEWYAFDAEEYFQRFAKESPDETIDKALVLMGFFSWLVGAGKLSEQQARGILLAIRDAAPPSQVVEDLCRSAVLSLSHFET